MSLVGHSGRPFAAGAIVLAVAMGVGRFAYTPLLVVMRRDAGLSVPMAGILASANLAGYLLGASLAMLPALKGRGTVMIRFGVVAVAVLTAAMALPEWIWVPARFLTGVASGIVFVLTVSILLDHAAAHQRRAGPAIVFSGIGFGIALVGMVEPQLAGLAGSRGTWVFFGLASFLAVPFTFDSLPRERATSRALSSPAPKGRDTSAFWWLAVVYGVEGAVYIIPATFLVAIVTDIPSIARFAGLTWVIVGLVAVPSAIAWTALARRIGLAPALLTSFVAQGLALLAPALAPGPLGVTALAVGLGATFMGISMLATSLARTYWPEKSNAAIGIMTALYGIGQIVGPLAATRVAIMTGSYRFALPIAGAALLVPTGVFAIRLLSRRSVRA